MKNIILTFIYLGLLLSCSTKTNKLESIVIDNFIDNNPQKIEASILLIEHINKKYAYYNMEIDSFLTDLTTKIDKYDKPYMIYDELAKKSIESIRTTKSYDINNLNSENIISHINTTFSSWERLKNVSGASFTDYKEYILPYRTMNEAIDLKSTALFYNENKHLIDTLLNGADFELYISKFIANQNFRIWNILTNKYHHHFSAYQTYRIKQVPRCDDAVICLINIFRSLGIPCSMDLLPQWGSHHSMGHSWIALKWQDEWHAFDAIDGKILKPIYKSSSIPKAYRINYYNDEYIDVSSEYKRTCNVQVVIPHKNKRLNSIPCVALFKQGGRFNIVETGKYNSKKMVFENLGNNVLYFPGVSKNNHFTPLGIPFYIDNNGSTHFFKNEVNLTYNTLKLERKYPLWTARNTKKIDHLKLLEGTLVLAKNTSLNIVDTLFTIKDSTSPLTKTFKINSKNKYDVILYRANKETWLSELHFFDKTMNEITGELINYGIRQSTIFKIFDNNIITYSGSPYPFTIGYKLDKPQVIAQITIDPLNDGNHIEIGDEYELMIWNNGWKSHGKKIAIKNELIYKNVPQNSVYWLKNLTKGIEELPFILTENGKQFWPGQ